MPLAAYGGSGMEEQPESQPATPDPAHPAAGAALAAASAPATVGARAPAGAAAVTEQPTAGDLPVPDDEPSRGPSPFARVVHLFRTSRLAAAAGFAVVIVIGLVLLSGGGASPAATAATPTKGPTPAPTIAPPSGEASVVISGAVKGTFPLTGLAGGQHVDATTVALGWGDAQQTTVAIAGPLDRGTRTTDEHLVLTITLLVNGTPATFTSNAGPCTVGMAAVGTNVQGSFTCHGLKSADGKLTIEASGSYHS
jgi:hypothetical protein